MSDTTIDIPSSLLNYNTIQPTVAEQRLIIGKATHHNCILCPRMLEKPYNNSHYLLTSEWKELNESCNID
jgi:hypothetical protein